MIASSVSTTASTSFSRYSAAWSAISSGSSTGWALPPAARRQVGAQVEEVDDTLQLVLVSDRELHRDAAVRELRANPLEGGEEVRALAVEHVDVEEARDAELLAPLPDTARLHLDAGDRIDDDERPFDHA